MTHQQHDDNLASLCRPWWRRMPAKETPPWSTREYNWDTRTFRLRAHHANEKDAMEYARGMKKLSPSLRFAVFHLRQKKWDSEMRP